MLECMLAIIIILFTAFVAVSILAFALSIALAVLMSK